MLSYIGKGGIMDFCSKLNKAVTVDRMVNTEVSYGKLIPNIYQYNFNTPNSGIDVNHYLHLGGGGNIEIVLPSSFHFSPLKCMMLLYSEQGGGRLRIQKKDFSVTEGNFFLHDCRIPFTLQSLVLPWYFKIFFILREPQSLFYPLFHTPGLAPLSCRDIPAIPMVLDDLIRIPLAADISSLLHMHQALTNLAVLYLDAFLPRIQPYPQKLPAYLNEMKDYMDNHYMEPFSLSVCEERLNVNQYRLCREFSSAFGDPPLRYLNKRRIEIAKKMLLNTKDSVQEISSKIGYETVTHFINQFKKRTGKTPQAFRRMAQASPPAGHCPSQ